MGMLVRGEPSESNSVLVNDDNDQLSSSIPLASGKAEGLMMTAATAVVITPMANARDSVEQLLALLAAKENELRTLQKTHDEYVKSSCEYERELESELERSELKTQSLELQVLALEETKVTLQATLSHSHHELAAAGKREDAFAHQVQDMKWTIQRLEQTNDELETTTRVAQASLDELQHRVDTLTEENVFLVQEKEDALAVAAKDREPQVEREENFSVGSPATGSIQAVVNVSRTASKRKSIRLPEVVESCLHLTCSHEQCRQPPQIPAPTAALAKPTKTDVSLALAEKTKPKSKSFFKRLRQWAMA